MLIYKIFRKGDWIAIFYNDGGSVYVYHRTNVHYFSRFWGPGSIERILNRYEMQDAKEIPFEEMEKCFEIWHEENERLEA